jgi:hypothetical protein
MKRARGAIRSTDPAGDEEHPGEEHRQLDTSCGHHPPDVVKSNGTVPEVVREEVSSTLENDQ